MAQHCEFWHNWPLEHDPWQLPFEHPSVVQPLLEHSPFEQTPPFGQTFPHPPQLLISPLMFLHVPEQLNSSDGHPLEETQFPLEQVCPEPQGVPHDPQFEESKAVLVHEPLQSIRPDGQL